MKQREQIVNRLLQNLEEIITPEELRVRLNDPSEQITHYIGFEISGYVHIGQGIMSALVIKDLLALDVECTVWLADWHSWMNDKLDGTKETAARIGTRYFTEAIKASLVAVGADPSKVEFRLASQWYKADPMCYWELVMTILKNTTQARLRRSISITGRQEGGETDAAKLMYPAMQAADIFYQNIELAHAGMDQRKAHVIVRDVASKLADYKKPMALHHPLLLGLQKPPHWPLSSEDQKDVIASMKMSKSNPNSAVWVHDSPEEIKRKINLAFCPEKEIHYNPILNWTKHILSWERTKPFIIDRPPQHGGRSEYATYTDLEAAFAKGEVHPQDLKNMVAQELIDLLTPVRHHFDQPEIGAMKEELDNILQRR